MRLIDANSLIEYWLQNGENEYVYDTNAFIESVDNAPTVDAEPVRHGHNNNRKYHEVDEYYQEYVLKYCPECGKKIYGDEQ